VLALVAALAGSAAAGSNVQSSAVSKKKVMKIAKKQAKKYFDANIGGASVAHAVDASSADNAAALGGLGVGAYQRRARWALVRAAGTIVRQSGGVRVQSAVDGLYQLNFGSNVRNSAILAIEVDNNTTKGAPSVLSCGDDEDPGFGNCVGAANENPNFVKVVTKEPGAVGTSPLPFYVAVLP
jgi:hypothetical protein